MSSLLLGRWRQEDHKSKACLDKLMRPFIKIVYKVDWWQLSSIEIS